MKQNIHSILTALALLFAVPCAYTQTTTISFESGEGYTVGMSGATLQAVNPSVLGTYTAVPDSASIVGSGISGSQALTVTNENDYVSVFANNSSGATSFSFSVQLQPGNDWAGSGNIIPYGTDAQVFMYNTNSSGTTLGGMAFGVDFSGHGTSTSAQYISTTFTGSLVGTGTAYLSTTTYTVSGNIDFITGQTALSVSDGATTIYSGSKSSSYATEDFVIILRGGGQYGTSRAVYDNVQMTAVPEPSTYSAIFGAAALGFAAWRRRRTAC